MPIFDFFCPQCDKIEEKYIHSPDAHVFCPVCGIQEEKKFGTFAFRGFPRIPRDHVPKEMGGSFDKKDAYWMGTESRYR